MKMRQRRLVTRLILSVIIAFLASMVLTWALHARITKREMSKLFDKVFSDVGADIRSVVDSRMIRKAMILRDCYYEMRNEPWWNDPDESSRRLKELATDLGVDEVIVANSDGWLTHSARRDEVMALNFCEAEGQAREFADLLTTKTEIAQPLLPNSLRGEKIKYVGVWLPDGGFVQVGGKEASVRNISRTALTGLTRDWHVSGSEGGIFITTAGGTVVSHPKAGYEGRQWKIPGDDFYWEKRIIEGFPVYIVVPKSATVADRRVLVSTSAFLNGMALVFAAILVGVVIARYIQDRMREQSAKEMAMARCIQEGAMPRVFPPFPDERRIDIFAMMNTAKEVGGDFYDFYFTGHNKVVFLIADVSGKGVGAALYMMRAKTTIKGIAQTGLPIDEVAKLSNDALSRDNDANMFVTVWIGEINLDTGVLQYVNAGHNPPISICASGKVDYMKARSGLAFGAMPGAKYKSHEVKLEKGDTIYLYTDGITEQPNIKGELYGGERLIAVLKSRLESGVKAVDGAFSPLIDIIFNDTMNYGGEAEQADDCTQLVLRYNG